jgi:DNA-binding PadR family transcriptional regulator
MTRKMPRNDSQEFLPLAFGVFHILAALRDGQKHGYAILQWLAQRTDGKVRLSPGTLYGAIPRLVRNEFIAKATFKVSAFEDQRRKYYRLTSLGKSILSAECHRLKEMLALANERSIPDGER